MSGLCRILAIGIAAAVLLNVSACALPNQSDEASYAVVKVPVANLGDAPKKTTGHNTVTQARMGDLLKIVESKDQWYQVEMQDGYRGWIAPADMHLLSEAALREFWNGRVALVTAQRVAARKTPGGENAYPNDLVQGSVLPVSSVRGDWTGLRIPGCEEVWVESSQVRLYSNLAGVFSQRKGASAVIETAKQYLGIPYLWGGTTAYGFDCSGFTQFCFKMNGYSILRDAGMQFQEGEKVQSRGDLLPGDLVFFETYQTGPSHVGIYLGESKYIHAGSRGVTINSFDSKDPDYSGYLDSRYYGARRILPVP